MSSISHRVAHLASQSAQSGFDAAVTIAARTQPGGASATETTRMVEETITAAFEGAVGASLAWGAFLFASALRGGATPTQFSHALVDVAEAASAPARRTVRANAKRLTKSSKTR